MSMCLRAITALAQDTRPVSGWRRGGQRMMSGIVSGEPHHFPLHGTLRPENTALVVIDMQHDFLSEGGYMHRLGADLSGLRKAIEPLRSVLNGARAWGCRIVHTREDMPRIFPTSSPGKSADRQVTPLPSATRDRAAGRSFVGSRASISFRNLRRHRASLSSTSQAMAPLRRPRWRTI